MGLSDTIRRKLACDRRGCGTEIEWNPQPGPGEKLPTKLETVISVSHPLSGTTKVYCSPDCAIVGINEGEYLPSKIELASTDQARAAVKDAETVRKLQVVE